MVELKSLKDWDAKVGDIFVYTRVTRMNLRV